MTYLNFERLNEIGSEAFQSQKPFPWINPKGWRLHEEVRSRVLRRNLERY